MTKSQANAVEQIKSYLNRQLDTVAERGHAVTEFKVDPIGKKLFISAHIEYTKLPLGNLLRAVGAEYYVFLVGARGAIECRRGPKSLCQFAGQRAFGMTIAADYAAI